MGLVCGKAVSAAVCTTSEALSERLQRMLLRWAYGECVEVSAEVTDSLSLPEDQLPELLFLDLDSVELPENGRMDIEKTGLIVISRDAGRAIHSYRWHPAAFLKPEFDMRRLSEALNACEKHWQSGRVCLESPSLRRAFRLPLGRVRYVEASAHYCLFNQGRQFVRFRFSTNELEELMPKPPFIRCHRSYLVHLGAVKEMTYTTLTLQDGARLPLGRTYIKPMKEAVQRWQKGEWPCDVFRISL